MFTKEPLEENIKKRHVLFFITSLRYGGAERVVVNLSRALVKSGRYKVTIMLLEDRADYSISDEVETLRLYYGHRGFIEKTRSLICDPFILKDYIENHKVDIVLSFMQRPNVINMLSRALGSRHLAYLNVRVYLTKQYENIPGIVRLFGKHILKRLWRYADRTIVNSQYILDEITSQFAISPDTVDLVYNPLDIKEIVDETKEHVEEEWFERKDIPVIMNVGRLTKQKGHIYLLKALSLMASKYPVRLAIIGDGELKNNLVKEARRLGISDKVFFMGWRKNPYKYIARSDVFVLPSLWEGFPNVVLEAMACRCPVVVSDCLSGPSEILMPQEYAKDKKDIIETKYGMLVNNLNAKNLSKAIEYILKDKSILKKYSDAGFERANHFNLSGIIKDYEDVLLKGLEKEKVEV